MIWGTIVLSQCHMFVRIELAGYIDLLASLRGVGDTMQTETLLSYTRKAIG